MRLRSRELLLISVSAVASGNVLACDSRSENPGGESGAGQTGASAGTSNAGSGNDSGASGSAGLGAGGAAGNGIGAAAGTSGSGASGGAAGNGGAAGSGVGGLVTVGSPGEGAGLNQCGVAAPLPAATGACATVNAPTIANFDDYAGGDVASYSFYVNGMPPSPDSVRGALSHVGDGSDASGSVIATEMVPGANGAGYALQFSNTQALNWGGLLMLYFPAGGAAGGCIDASSYGGVELTIRGSAPSGRVGVNVSMLDTIPSTDSGLCTNPTAGDCKDATIGLDLPSDPGLWAPIRIPWSAFTPGVGSDTMCVPNNGQNIVRLVIQPFMAYPPPDFMFAPGAYSIAIDDVRFYGTGDPGGMGGAGGMGGGAGGVAGAGGGAGAAGAAGIAGEGGAAGSAGAAGEGGAAGSAGAAGDGGVAGTGGGVCAIPPSLEWASTGPVIAPVSDATHDILAVKDPSIVYFDDRYHVYASSVSTEGAYNLVYTSFADFSEAPTAPFYYMDQTPGFDTYVAAPQLFYFTPQNKWYLVFQSGPPMYSTADDPSDPTSWTAPQPFYAGTPAIITAHGGGWLDYWVICDDEFCHLFFSSNQGRWYKARTSIQDFPNGMDEPVVVMHNTNNGRIFEASNVYKLNGSNQYLALIEAFDQTSNNHRYFRSWLADSLEGPWLPWQGSGSFPFAGERNVTFEGTAWTPDISHGELVRAGYDEKLAIEPCNLRFLYQGADPLAETGGDYNKIPWHLGLITQVP